MRLILGSQSPRRKEILNYFALPFEQNPPLFDESTVPFMDNPTDFVRILSKKKAESLSVLNPAAAILTADTIVYRDHKIYPKPTCEEEANQALTELAGNWHSVYTGVSLYYQHKVYSQWEETSVLFNPLTPEEIRHYQARIHWADKAGGYAIQMAGGLIVRRIEGCYYNVMGLPVNSVRDLLKNIGIELWDYVR